MCAQMSRICSQLCTIYKNLNCVIGQKRITLRPDAAITPSDKARYFEWFNDAESRCQSHNADPVSWAHQDARFDQRRANLFVHLWVLETPEGLPVGQARVEPEGADTIVSYSIDPAFRRRGWGTQPLHLAVNAWRVRGEATFLIAETLAGNKASRRAPQRPGFSEESRIAAAGYRYRLRS